MALNVHIGDAMAMILVIDDEPELVMVFRDILTKAHHEVVTASGARQGLATYRTRRPDLVIADIFLPDESGLNLIFELTRDREVKVIAISGGGHKAGVDFLEYARSLGAWRTLDKPVRRDELLATVSEALDSGAARTGKSRTAEPTERRAG